MPALTWEMSSSLVESVEVATSVTARSAEGNLSVTIELESLRDSRVGL